MKKGMYKQYLVTGFFLVAIFIFLNVNLKCTPDENKIENKPNIDSKIDSEVMVLDGRGSSANRPIYGNVTFVLESLQVEEDDLEDVEIIKKKVMLLEAKLNVLTKFMRYSSISIDVLIAPETMNYCLGVNLNGFMDDNQHLINDASLSSTYNYILTKNISHYCQETLKSILSKSGTFGIFYSRDFISGNFPKNYFQLSNEGGNYVSSNTFLIEDSFGEIVSTYEILFETITGQALGDKNRSIYFNMDNKNIRPILDNQNFLSDIENYRFLIEDYHFSIIGGNAFDTFYEKFGHFVMNPFYLQLKRFLFEEDIDSNFLFIPSIPLFEYGQVYISDKQEFTVDDLKRLFKLTYFNWRSRIIKHSRDEVFNFSLLIKSNSLLNNNIVRNERVTSTVELINWCLKSKYTSIYDSNLLSFVMSSKIKIKEAVDALKTKFPGHSVFNFPQQNLSLTYYDYENVLREFFQETKFVEEFALGQGSAIFRFNGSNNLTGSNKNFFVLFSADLQLSLNGILNSVLSEQQIYYKTSTNLEKRFSFSDLDVADFMVIYEK